MMSPTRNKCCALLRRRKSARKSPRHPRVPKWVSEIKMLRYSVRAPNPEVERRGAFINAEHIPSDSRRFSEVSMTRRKIHTLSRSHGFVIKPSLKRRALVTSLQPYVAAGEWIRAGIPKGHARMVIVFNPVAGRRRAHLLWRVLDVLVANGVRLELTETCRTGHAEVLALKAVKRGEPMVVAAGGDGTIAEVANGLMGTDARLGVIPLGTANVLAHELGLPFSPKAVAAALAFGRTTTLWPGVASSTQGNRLFLQMLGVGFDAHV